MAFAHQKIDLVRFKRRELDRTNMFDTNTESTGMVLLIACLVGVVASVVGIRMYILFKK
jgi:hypothetical protein